MISIDIKNEEFDIDFGNGKLRTATLESGHITEFDGVLWISIGCSAISIESDFTLPTKVIKNGDVVLVNGVKHKVEVTGEYSDAGFFKPVEDEVEKEQVKAAIDSKQKEKTLFDLYHESKNENVKNHLLKLIDDQTMERRKIYITEKTLGVNTIKGKYILSVGNYMITGEQIKKVA